MNHSRCCANDNGASTSRLAGLIGRDSLPTPPPLSLSMTAANSLTVGLSNNSRSGVSTSNASLTRDITCVASSECPPSSKKFASSPIRSSPRTSPQIPSTIPSTAVLSRSSSFSSTSSSSGAASLPRSSFPFPVTGNSATSTYLRGVMCSGNFFFRYSRNSSAPGARPQLPTTYATSLFSPLLSSHSFTAHRLTPSCSPRTASISSTSILNPLIFTWPSLRPSNSILPSQRYLPRSPLRYNLSPSSLPNGCGIILSAVSSGAFWYPRANPPPLI